MELKTKVCRHCRQELPATLEYFYKAGNKRVGLRAVCKKCNSLESTPGKERDYKYKGACSAGVRNTTVDRLYSIKQNYKTTPEVIMELMDEQKGCCAICGDSLVHPDSKKNYHIDHCHKSEEIRGLLCGKCNFGIGFLRDSIYNLGKAIEYLTK